MYKNPQQSVKYRISGKNDQVQSYKIYQQVEIFQIKPSRVEGGNYKVLLIINNGKLRGKHFLRVGKLVNTTLVCTIAPNNRQYTESLEKMLKFKPTKFLKAGVRQNFQNEGQRSCKAQIVKLYIWTIYEIAGSPTLIWQLICTTNCPI